MAALPECFWKKVTIEQNERGLYGPALDGRVVRLSGGEKLYVSALPLAEALAEEWAAFSPGDEVSADKIPLTRIVGSQIEQIAPYLAETEEALFAFGLDEALCYPSPAWDPVIAERIKSWMLELNSAFSLPQATDLTPLEHKESYKQALRKLIKVQSLERLTALRIMAPLLGSFWLPFALTAGILTPEEGFAFGYADEYNQLEEWGEDKEFLMSLERRQQELLDVMRYWNLVQSVV